MVFVFGKEVRRRRGKNLIMKSAPPWASGGDGGGTCEAGGKCPPWTPPLLVTSRALW